MTTNERRNQMKSSNHYWLKFHHRLNHELNFQVECPLVFTENLSSLCLWKNWNKLKFLFPPDLGGNLQNKMSPDKCRGKISLFNTLLERKIKIIYWDEIGEMKSKQVCKNFQVINQEKLKPDLIEIANIFISYCQCQD